MTESSVLTSEQKTYITTPKYVSLEAYFRAEEKSLTKHEYHDGIVIPMAGAKLRHNRLASRAVQQFENFVEERALDFIVSNSDTKIRIEDFNKIVYPDAVVISATPQYFNGREDTIINPILVVEVLSVSTSRYDRKTKFEYYRTLPSFKEYVLIAQYMPWVSASFKIGNRTWQDSEAEGLESSIFFKSIDCTIDLKKIYRGIKF